MDSPLRVRGCSINGQRMCFWRSVMSCDTYPGSRGVGLDFQSDLKVSSVESQPPAPIPKWYISGFASNGPWVHYKRLEIRFLALSDVV